jgi:DNA-binding GntR family transcriptional regulator
MDQATKEERRSCFAAEEARLHSMLYAATGNVALKEFIEGQYDLFTRIWFNVERTPIDLLEQLNHWKDIYQALYERDEEKVVASNRKHFKAYFDRLKSMR